MLKSLLQHKGKIAVVVLIVCCLALVRMYEDVLFYDPLLDYFKRSFMQMPFPAMDNWKLLANLFLRYAINTSLSLGMIHALFRNWDLAKFALLLYVVFFVMLVVSFFVVLAFFEDGKMVLFYIRRFLIQPVFLLLFVPAFYFQERASKKNNVS